MRTFGIIGYPLEHSFSKQFFREKFIRENIPDAVYKMYPLEDLSSLRNLIKDRPGLLGLNVTIPYKTDVLPMLDALDSVAETVGAVNVIRIDRAAGAFKLIGFNSDVHGFNESLRPLLRKHHRKALILGTGGSSKAVAYVLKEMGIRFERVSRNRHENEQSYEKLDASLIRRTPIIINTTPVGMYPDVTSCPEIPFEGITADHLVYDLIYNPPKTALLERCEARGARIKNGFEMLELQAEKSWEIWNR